LRRGHLSSSRPLAFRKSQEIQRIRHWRSLSSHICQTKHQLAVLNSRAAGKRSQNCSRTSSQKWPRNSSRTCSFEDSSSPTTVNFAVLGPLIQTGASRYLSSSTRRATIILTMHDYFPIWPCSLYVLKIWSSLPVDSFRWTSECLQVWARYYSVLHSSKSRFTAFRWSSQLMVS
jgi:hypothetical protein